MARDPLSDVTDVSQTVYVPIGQFLTDFLIGSEGIVWVQTTI